MHADIIVRPAKPVDTPYLLPAHRPVHKQLRREETGSPLPAPGSIATRLPYESGKTYDLPREMERETPLSPTPEAYLEPSFPKFPEIEVRIGRKLERHFSLAEEGIKLADIDSISGKKGFTVQNPTDKRKVKGFVLILEKLLGFPAGYNRLCRALPELGRVANLLLDIEVKPDTTTMSILPQLLKYPIIYISTALTVFEMNPIFARRIGEYMQKGGFVIFDMGNHAREPGLPMPLLKRHSSTSF